ncbi:hypothetical protein AALO_G00049570 [Alosa alosa]|uniref:Uncharacterized protein n=1 Tax=Alosa alosa TaxID=278164 RepID=A0AAV6H3F8_9TELE|nr:hypothetical protein AALO_G00049570 [Alosa alosa]
MALSTTLRVQVEHVPHYTSAPLVLLAARRESADRGKEENHCHPGTSCRQTAHLRPAHAAQSWPTQRSHGYYSQAILPPRVGEQATCIAHHLNIDGRVPLPANKHGLISDGLATGMRVPSMAPITRGSWAIVWKAWLACTIFSAVVGKLMDCTYYSSKGVTAATARHTEGLLRPRPSPTTSMKLPVA